MAKKQSDKVRPVEEIRIGGIKAAIWRNQSQKGAWFKVTFQRLYRSEEGQWRGTGNFGRDDLLLLAKVADAVHTRVQQLLDQERPAQQESLPGA